MYHHMVSYLIKAGQVDLHGGQLLAKQCYQVAIELGQQDPTKDEPELSSANEQ